MKADRILVASLLALASSTLPSLAGNPNIDNHFFHGRREVQLTDDSALFRDLRSNPNVPQTVIIEAPMQTQPGAPPMVIRPSSNAPGITVIHSSLPDAGFQSAINPGNQGRMIKNLPNGNSTNLLSGKMLSQPKQQSSSATRPLAAVASVKPMSAPSSPVTMVYAAQPSSFGSQNRNVTTAVKGTLQRGSLISSQH